MRSRCSPAADRPTSNARLVMPEAYTDRPLRSGCARITLEGRRNGTMSYGVIHEGTMLQNVRPSTAHRAWVAALGSVLALSLLLPARPTAAAEPNEAAGARLLAERNGGGPADYVLVHQADAAVPDGSTLWSGKYVDQRTGAIHVVHREGAGAAVADEGLHAQRVDSAKASQTALERKGDAELRAAVAAAGGRVTAAGAPADVPVGLW